jgi:hypothetical protein
MKKMITTIIIGAILATVFIATDSRGQFPAPDDIGVCFMSCAEKFSQEENLKAQERTLLLCSQRRIEQEQKIDSLLNVIRELKKKK